MPGLAYLKKRDSSHKNLRYRSNFLSGHETWPQIGLTHKVQGWDNQSWSNHALLSTKHPDLLMWLCGFQVQTGLRQCSMLLALRSWNQENLGHPERKSARLSAQNHVILLFHFYVLYQVLVLLRVCSQILVQSKNNSLQIRYTESSKIGIMLHGTLMCNWIKLLWHILLKAVNM